MAAISEMISEMEALLPQHHFQPPTPTADQLPLFSGVVGRKLTTTVPADKGKGKGKAKGKEKSPDSVPVLPTQAIAKMVPNTGNGLDLERYSWTQTLEEIIVCVPIPKGTEASSVICEIKKNHLKAGLKEQLPIIEGDLHQCLKLDDCIWSIEDGKIISALLTKQNQRIWWNCLLKGEPEIDTELVEPEPSMLSDLDLETRQTVEQLMFDQRQRSRGILTEEEMQQRIMLQKLVAKYPELDIGNMEFL